MFWCMVFAQLLLWITLKCMIIIYYNVYNQGFHVVLIYIAIKWGEHQTSGVKRYLIYKS